MSDISFDMNQTAEWRRRKAEKFPSDYRNAAAADLLENLASMETSYSLEEAYISARNECIGAEDATSETLREIGFHSNPSSLDEVLRSVTERIRAIDQDEAKRKFMEQAGLTEDEV